MIFTNKKTGEDMTHLVGKLMHKEITNEQFEEMTGLEPSEENPHRAAWLKRQELKNK